MKNAKNKTLSSKIIYISIYSIIFLFFNNLSQAYRYAEGTDFFVKFINAFDNFDYGGIVSFNPNDIIIGLLGVVIIYLYQSHKKKNAKKFRYNSEFGSSRWGTPEDIHPYLVENEDENIILTQTEGLMLNSRPQDPKYARNKNVLIIGGSGSGKTRFFVKPNLMQLHTSYVITDPKGVVL